MTLLFLSCPLVKCVADVDLYCNCDVCMLQSDALCTFYEDSGGVDEFGLSAKPCTDKLDVVVCEMTSE